MLLQAAREWGIDLKQSFMVGDKLSDAEAGIRAGVKATILFGKDAASDPRETEVTMVAKDFREVTQFILGY
jgi:histidinol phosphatase-like enzyme